MNPGKRKPKLNDKKALGGKMRIVTGEKTRVRVWNTRPTIVDVSALEESEITARDARVAIVKNGILHDVPFRPLRETKGMIPGLNNKGLRDKGDRMSSTGMCTKKLRGNKNRFGGSRIKKTSKQAVAGDLLDYIRTIAPDEELASALERVLEKRKLIKIGANRWEA